MTRGLYACTSRLFSAVSRHHRTRVAALKPRRTHALQTPHSRGVGRLPSQSALAQEWTRFVSPEDGFSANYPGQPKVETTTYLGIPPDAARQGVQRRRCARALLHHRRGLPRHRENARRPRGEMPGRQRRESAGRRYLPERLPSRCRRRDRSRGVELHEARRREDHAATCSTSSSWCQAVFCR